MLVSKEAFCRVRLKPSESGAGVIAFAAVNGSEAAIKPLLVP
jgi:hypothetical protein